MFITKKAALAATMALAVFSIVPTGYVSVAHAKKACVCTKFADGWSCSPNRKRCYKGLSDKLGVVSVWGGRNPPAEIQALSKETGGKVKVLQQAAPKVDGKRTTKFSVDG